MMVVANAEVGKRELEDKEKVVGRKRSVKRTSVETEIEVEVEIGKEQERGLMKLREREKVAREEEVKHSIDELLQGNDGDRKVTS